ncbi:MULTISPECIES: hypothetical protein [unclassified Nocardiopsis]|uniref:hypothetical protein n=1 Tax=unclassified Nocardiopsis TaxID=2649073 RepID=UPI0013589FCF|nr:MULTISPECIES: hypothetical protein [unclassified Nocardiopsis]
MRYSPLFSLPLALLLAATACSGEGEPSEEATGADTAVEGAPEAEAVRAAEGFVASLQAADGEAGCALMDEAARQVLAEARGEEDCATAFPGYADSLQGGEGIEVGEATMGSDLEGDTPIATVTLVYPGEDHGPLEVRRDSDDQWVATRLPGIALGGA